MSTVYLFRHGQAGKRAHYDELSPLGVRQAEALGEYLVANGFRFEAVWAGSLQRQQQTAEAVQRAYRAAGVPLPGIVVDPTWNEFDIDGVFHDMIPRLTADDPAFRAAYQAQLAQMADPNSAVQHQWSDCDMASVMAWIGGRYPSSGETWREFCARAVSARAAFEARPNGVNVAVFTSATPVGMWMSRTLGFDPVKALQLAGVMYNSAISTFKTSPGGPCLESFNSIPHLTVPDLRTLR
jgi:broad specificity phosphatase PhoE